MGHFLKAEDIASPKDHTPPRALTQAEIRQVFVPANESKLWPQGDWQVLERKEYKRLLAGTETGFARPGGGGPSPRPLSGGVYRRETSGPIAGPHPTHARTAGCCFPGIIPIWLLSKLSWAEKDGTSERCHLGQHVRRPHALGSAAGRPGENSGTPRPMEHARPPIRRTHGIRFAPGPGHA